MPRRAAPVTPVRVASAADVGAMRVPRFYTAEELAEKLRTSRTAIYAMRARGQLPGLTRIGRRVLFREDALIHRLDQRRAPSPKE